MKLWCRLALVVYVAAAQAQQADAPNALLLVAKPGLPDPNFRETVVLVTQAPDFSTVGVILNRPTQIKHDRSAEPIYSGGPVLPQTLVVLFRSDSAPAAPAFHVLKRVYLSLHPDNIGRDGWHVLAADEELVFRKDTAGMWRELLERARGERAQRENVTNVAIRRSRN